MNLNQVIRVQGRALFLSEVSGIQQLIDQHPQWSRHRVAKTLCARWSWRTPLGQLKTFAARSLLLKLAQRQALRLPPLREACRRSPWGLSAAGGRVAAPPPPAVGLETRLATLQPLAWRLAGHGAPER